MSAPDSVTISLCGDVMTGRAIDQVLPYPGEPVLYEGWVTDAREYVRLAEEVSEPIPRPVEFRYVWGEALEVLQEAGVEVRIVNLETSVTRSPSPWPGKGIHYRMHPRNVEVLTAAGIHCCCLANNHVLDWGRPGLTETLQTLAEAGLAAAGAGGDIAQATAPAVVPVPGKGRVLVFAFGLRSSGIPPEWAAAEGRSGVSLLPDLSAASAQSVLEGVRAASQPGDLIIASVHWGPNWGHEVPHEQVRFAHALVRGGVDVVHGHSSHHPKAAEVYRDRLILYGCGDFINDYEGIGGHEEYRPDLRLAYLVQLEMGSGRLREARLVPFQPRAFRLYRAAEADQAWLCRGLGRHSAPFRTVVETDPRGRLRLRGT